MAKHHLSAELIENIKEHPDEDSLPGGTALSIDDKLCLNLRGRTLSCTACASLCVAGALKISEDAVVLNADKCTGCGACLPSCPAGVFSISSFSPSHFLDELKGNGEAHIRCSASIRKTEGITIPCLHLLDARLAAAAFSVGIRIFHLYGLSHCEQCDKGNAINHIMATQSRLMQWFGVNSAPLMIASTVPLTEWVEDHHRHEEQAQMNRRQFFHQAGLHAVASANLYSAQAEEDDTLQAPQGFTQVNIEHQQPVKYQSLLAETVAELPWILNEIPWHGRAINDECNACLACGQRCPTGALQVEQTDAGRGISFKTGLCTDCGLCAQVCPMSAVKRYKIKNVVEVIAPRSVLMYRHDSTCQNCAGTFVPQTEEEQLCPACSNEQTLESEWLAQWAH